MTEPASPEQIQRMIEELPESLRNLKLFYSIASLIVIGLGIGLIAYLKKKAENLAQVEDIEAITSKVENIKEEVRLIGKKHEIHYSFWFQQKADALCKIYGRLSSLQRNLSKAVADSAVAVRLTDDWYRCRDEIWEIKYLIDDSKMFLDEVLEEQLNKVVDAYMAVLQKITITENRPVNIPVMFVETVQSALDESGPLLRKTLDDLASAFKNHIRQPGEEEPR